MKRLLLIVSILLSFQALAASPGKSVPKTRITSVLSECRGYEGAEVFHLGRFTTGLMKGAVRIAAADDAEAREVMRLAKGIRGVSILHYEECAAADRERIARKVERLLDGCELLMEAADGDGKMKIYGTIVEKTDQVRDIVLYSSSDCTLICLFGTLSMAALASLASHD